MPDQRIDIKEGCRQYGKTLSDLCRASGIPYNRLSGAVCGYWALSPLHDSLVRKVFRLWQDQHLNNEGAKCGEQS
jgi:hypothetical protein